jgi:hypothetical protein
MSICLWTDFPMEEIGQTTWAIPEGYISGQSCRQQIRQTTDRRALHLAQVLQMAIDGEAGGSLENLSRWEFVAA